MKIKIAHIIIILMVSLGTISCKKAEVYSDTPVIMQFGYKTTGNDAMDSFVENDQIAMFVIDADKDPEFTDFKYANCIYKLTNVNWTPIDQNKTTMWEPGAKPVFIYSYSPIAKANSPISPANHANTVLDIVLPLNQTTTELKTLDLLYSRNKGENGGGLSLENNESSNVNLSFRHRFCKVSFSVFVKANDMIIGDVTLKSLQLKGRQTANKASFELHNAALNITQLTTDQFYHSTKDVVLTPTNNFVEDNSYNVDFVILPFQPLLSADNMFVFLVSYTNSENVNVETELLAKIPEYVGGNEITFNENMQTVIKATLLITDNDVLINNTITDWNDNQGGEEIKPI